MEKFLNLIRLLIPRRYSKVVIGGIKIVGRNKRGFGIRGIALKGINIEPELEFVANYLQNGDIFLDVGANTGIYTLHASKLVGSTGFVMAFEPNIEIAFCLSRSVILNKFNNIVILPFGVSSKQEINHFFHNFGKPNSYSLSKHDSNATQENIYTTSIDQLLINQKIEKLQYIKIDVEGSESEVIRGGYGIISKYRPLIQVEFTISEVRFDLPQYIVIHLISSPNLLLVPLEKLDSVTNILRKDFEFEILS